MEKWATGEFEDATVLGERVLNLRIEACSPILRPVACSAAPQRRRPCLDLVAPHLGQVTNLPIQTIFLKPPAGHRCSSHPPLSQAASLRTSAAHPFLPRLPPSHTSNVHDNLPHLVPPQPSRFFQGPIIPAPPRTCLRPASIDPHRALFTAPPPPPFPRNPPPFHDS